VTGRTVWLTGLPSAGKTTIAHGVSALLRADGIPVDVLDGDDLRRDLTAGLGFSREDREENVRRIGIVAGLLARNGITVLVPVIAPYAAGRDRIRARHTEQGIPFLEVHVDTPVDVCASRDVKGLYARQRSGDLTGLTGVDSPYEPPVRPELRVFAHGETVQTSVRAVYELLTPPADGPATLSRRRGRSDTR
jgi:adenylylsulfate kinase